jgi:hypothetical protein
MIKRFLFPSKKGAKTPKNTMLLTPDDRLIKHYKTFKIYSANFISFAE